MEPTKKQEQAAETTDRNGTERKKGVVVKLFEPLKVDGEVIETLMLRRAKAGDMLRAQEASASQARQEIHLFGALTRTNPEVLEELDLADYRKLQEAFNGFLEA